LVSKVVVILYWYLMKEIKYQSWPLGKLKAYQLRKEPYLIKNKGYAWKDPWDIVNIFEKKVARFSGCKYAVAVDCCSHGIFLTLKFLNAKKIITIPKRTYVSVPMQIKHAGCKIRFKEIKWEGAYRLDPFPIWDFAGRWTEGMFNGEFNILSFQLKKRISLLLLFPFYATILQPNLNHNTYTNTIPAITCIQINVFVSIACD
jgi:hypothetical protein